jgi:Tfp pilus assembly protein PilO
VTARLASLSTKAQIAVIAGVLLLAAVVGYLVLISPKRSTAADLKRQTNAVQLQIDHDRSTGFTQALPAVRAANVFSVAEAMPKQLDTPDLILQLNQLAGASGISFDSIQPSAASSTASSVPTGTPDPFAAEPIQVQFTGSFYNFLTFLQRLRNLVRVENGKLFAAGRLFDVSAVAFGPGVKGFPQIQATLTINAFVPQTPAPAVPTTTSTTDTTTTTSNPTSASPSTSGGTS